MAVLTIGRVGIDVEIDGVIDQTMSGDSLRFRIEVYAGLADALAIRQQLLGYTSQADEQYVPVTWTSEAAVDGYYRLLDAAVSTASDAETRIIYLDVELERVPGYAAPLLELRTLGTVRPNPLGLDAGDTTNPICVPDASQSVAFYSADLETYIPFAPDVVRSGATGAVKVYRMGQTDYLTQFYLDPHAHYAGAATILAGDPLRAVVGRQVRNQPKDWRVTNGLIELEARDTTTFDLQMRMWIDGAWSMWTPFSFAATTFGAGRAPLPAPHAITVLRNGPEEVAVRLLTASPLTSGQAYSPVTVDFSLKRGARYITFELRSVFQSAFALRSSDFVAATADEPPYLWKTIGGGVRMLITAPQTIHQTDLDVHPYQDSVTNVESWSAAVGLVKASDTEDNVLETVEEYMFAHATKQAVVAQ